MLPVAGREGASTRYRVLAHRPGLEAAGFSTEVRLPLDLGRHGLSRLPWRAADMLRDLYGSSAADLLFIHRKMFLPGLSSRLRRESRVVVFDMDDALDLPPPGRRPGEWTLERYRRNFEATVEAADLVLCGNPYLASRLPHERYEILPTAIDTVRFSPGAVEPASGATLGWVGHSDNLGYLEALAAPLRELSRRHPGLRLIVVADRRPGIPGVEVEFRRWSLDREVSCFGGMRVGLMPLEDNPWTRGKCSFKAIQYMALGLPTVASPVGMNRDLIRDGENGYLAGDEAAWVEALDALLSDPALAARIGAAGRETVEREYALRVVSAQLVEILAALLHEGPRGYWELVGL